MTPRKLILALFVVGSLYFLSCKTLIFGSSSYEDVSEARAADQTSFEDSAKVFFATYVNPYSDKDFLWFAVFTEGAVEMHVHDVESDSLQAIYHFEKQEMPLHTIAMHQHKEHFVKCVLYVDGKIKCAKLYPAWYPIQIRQFKTQYTISNE